MRPHGRPKQLQPSTPPVAARLRINMRLCSTSFAYITSLTGHWIICIPGIFIGFFSICQQSANACTRGCPAELQLRPVSYKPKRAKQNAYRYLCRCRGSNVVGGVTGPTKASIPYHTTAGCPGRALSLLRLCFLFFPSSSRFETVARRDGSKLVRQTGITRRH